LKAEAVAPAAAASEEEIVGRLEEAKEEEEIAVTPVLLGLMNGFCFLTRNAAEMGGHGIWGGENK
jgi:hypothetical protein